MLLAGPGIISGCAQKEKDESEVTRKIEEEDEPEEKEETTVSDHTSFVLESPAFEDGGDIPVKYAKTGVSGGENVSIPLSWKNVSAEAKSFVVAMVDRHPIANNWVHWLVIDIPSYVDLIPEGSSGSAQMPQGSKELANTFGSTGYGGPQPPPGSGSHDYQITVYALNVESIDLAGEVSARELEGALQGEIIGSAQIVGRFER